VPSQRRGTRLKSAGRPESIARMRLVPAATRGAPVAGLSAAVASPFTAPGGAARAFVLELDVSPHVR
jgi:hypothetical protein